MYLASKKLFCTIGEVAQELSLEQHVLRFWEEKFSQIKPVKRRGRRLYDYECVEIIKKIKHMLYDKGYTIKGVQKELNAKNHDILSEEFLKDILKELENLKSYLITKINKYS
ncbi:MerR family transcriptional regulator [Wolbachia endosymbiont of Pentidionis agamae]|uniref:MerR family transcriptional regulator n=1 Tax=Wolbachia endosymbiont of Pentidionis agamae TaxID=3110435 RepID=UPI002FD482B7